jgi:predicted DNA-binding ribbon-helix-helix protein
VPQASGNALPGHRFLADRAFYATLEARRLLYDFAARGRSMKKSLVLKRSVNLGDRKTSISLEAAFWTALKVIAHERHESPAHLITSIDAHRKAANLSSVLRVFVLEFYKAQFARHAGLSSEKSPFSRKKRRASILGRA